MKLGVNYIIKDILHNEQFINTETKITEEDLPFVKKIINKLNDFELYNCIFLTDDNGNFIRMFYDSFEDRENKILKVALCKSNAYKTDVIWERKMPRASVYKLVKKALETGLDEDLGIE